MARNNALALAIWAISSGWRESLWATKEKRTHEPKKPSKLKNALREYNLSSSSVRNEANILLMLAIIISASLETTLFPLFLFWYGTKARTCGRASAMNLIIGLETMAAISLGVMVEHVYRSTATLRKKRVTFLITMIGIGCLTQLSSHIALNSPS